MYLPFFAFKIEYTEYNLTFLDEPLQHMMLYGWGNV